MKLSRRFIFHGHACAFSGRAYRPRAIAGQIASPASSALSVAGGVSHAEVKKRIKVGSWLSVGSALTHAEGSFDDVKQALEMTWHKVPEEALSSTSLVRAVVTDVVIDGGRLRVKLLKASLRGTSPTRPDDTPIELGRDTDVRGLEIDGHPLTVVLNRELFQAPDTARGFARRIADAKVAADAGPAFFVDGTPEQGMYATTIVRELKWTRKPHPSATIDGHTVIVPDFGRIFLGEMLLTSSRRRLTLMRLEMGSPFGIRIGFNDVETNGSWYPP